MKMIYLVQYFPPEQASGLQLVEDLLEGFAKQGWDVDLFTPTPTRGVTGEQRKEYVSKRTEKIWNGKVTIHRMHLYREGTGFISRALRYVIFSIECFWKAVTVPADVIFTGSGPPTQGVVVGLAKKLSRKKKFIYNLQDIFPDSLVTSGICNEDSILMKIGRIMENFTYKSADKIITITNDMKANVLSKNVDYEKLEVVRNWIDVEKIIPVLPEDNLLFDEYNIDRKKFNIVYAGNLGRVQGVDILVSAAEMLQDKTDIHFVIFGNGSEEEKIKKKVSQLSNLSIFPLQPMNRISEVYSLGDICIIPCQAGAEGSSMPSKTWSIMATGTPIIASFDLGGEMEKTLKEAGCGYCVPAGDASALAEKIKTMKEDPDDLMVLGKNARNYAIEHVSKEQSVKKYIDIIEGLCR